MHLFLAWYLHSPSLRLHTNRPACAFVYKLRCMNRLGSNSPVQKWWHRPSVTKSCLNAWQMYLILMPFLRRLVGDTSWEQGSGGLSLCPCSKCVIKEYSAIKTNWSRYIDPNLINFQSPFSLRTVALFDIGITPILLIHHLFGMG